MKKLGKLLFDFFASYALCVTLMAFMFLVILLGTLYQVDHGLYEAQKKYFDSLIVLHHLGPLTVPLPGAYLLMAVLAINLVCGGFIRIRKSKYTIGILIIHFGIAFMLVSCALTFHFADRGNMRLFEPAGSQPGWSSDEFVSYMEWNIEIGDGSTTSKLHIIPDEMMFDLKGGKSRTFYSDDLPFDVIVSDYKINAFVSPKRPMMPTDARLIDNYYLETMPSEVESEMNAPGTYISVKDKETGTITEGILWAYAAYPLTVNSGGEDWTFELTQKRWRVPFVLTLDEFIHDKHAGTAMAKNYESKVTKTEGDSQDKIRIWMNHPLRHKGYTFFQASWGPTNAQEGERLFSVFSVVKNPGDQGPLYACIIVGIGMLIHFCQKLLTYMRIEAKRRES